MLVLGRRIGEKVIVGEDIVVQVLKYEKGTVSLGFEAPKEVRIDREEIREKINAEKAKKESA